MPTHQVNGLRRNSCEESCENGITRNNKNTKTYLQQTPWRWKGYYPLKLRATWSFHYRDVRIAWSRNKDIILRENYLPLGPKIAVIAPSGNKISISLKICLPLVEASTDWILANPSSSPFSLFVDSWRAMVLQVSFCLIESLSWWYIFAGWFQFSFLFCVVLQLSYFRLI